MNEEHTFYKNHFCFQRAFNGMDKDGIGVLGPGPRERNSCMLFFSPHEVVFFFSAFYSPFIGVGRGDID